MFQILNLLLRCKVFMLIFFCIYTLGPTKFKIHNMAMIRSKLFLTSYYSNKSEHNTIWFCYQLKKMQNNYFIANCGINDWNFLKWNVKLIACRLCFNNGYTNRKHPLCLDQQFHQTSYELCSVNLTSDPCVIYTWSSTASCYQIKQDADVQ